MRWEALRGEETHHTTTIIWRAEVTVDHSLSRGLFSSAQWLQDNNSNMQLAGVIAWQALCLLRMTDNPNTHVPMSFKPLRYQGRKILPT